MAEKSKEKQEISGDARKMRRRMQSIANTLGWQMKVDYYLGREAYYRNLADQLGDSPLANGPRREAEYCGDMAQKCRGS